MLKIKDNVDLKELKKYKIYPKYECNECTGQTRITELCTTEYKLENLRFIKKTRPIIKGMWSIKSKGFNLIVNNRSCELVDLDLLYDLIKDGLVIKED